MALKLDVNLPSGFVANYWKLYAFHYDGKDNKLTALFDIYASNALRQVPGTLPADSRAIDVFKIGSADITGIMNSGAGDPFAGIYTYMKTLPMFNGSTDL